MTDAASSLVCLVGLDEWECATGLEVERLAVIVVSTRLYILDYAEELLISHVHIEKLGGFTSRTSGSAKTAVVLDIDDHKDPVASD